MFTDIEKVIKKLSIHYPQDTPVAIVQHAGYRDKERVVIGSIGTIVNRLKGENPPFEYMIYVGDFLSYRFEKK
jgi:precorrin-4/cobalt-precorrin-4 C11-methyltransferase